MLLTRPADGQYLIVCEGTNDQTALEAVLVLAEAGLQAQEDKDTDGTFQAQIDSCWGVLRGLKRSWTV
jgi:hypothetical protein